MSRRLGYGILYAMRRHKAWRGGSKAPQSSEPANARAQKDTNMVPARSKNDLKMIPNQSKHDPTWFQNDYPLRIELSVIDSDSKLISKSFQNVTKMFPKWHQNEAKMTKTSIENSIIFWVPLGNVLASIFEGFWMIFETNLYIFTSSTLTGLPSIRTPSIGGLTYSNSNWSINRISSFFCRVSSAVSLWNVIDVIPYFAIF